MYPFVLSFFIGFGAPATTAVHVTQLDANQRAAMLNITWRPDCPVPLEKLRRVEVPYLSPTGETLRGSLIVHEQVANEVGEIFHKLHQIGFIVEDISPALSKHGKDEALMRSNITSAFNCRAITGGKGFSRHSFGKAIDINPLWNPYIKGKRVLPQEAPAFARPPRDLKRPGLIHARSEVVAIFRAHGWQWGGSWKRLKDFQHFEKKPR